MRAHTAPREMRLIAGKPESVDGAPWRQRRGIPFREGGMFMKVLELFSGTRSIGEALPALNSRTPFLPHTRKPIGWMLTPAPAPPANGRP